MLKHIVLHYDYTSSPVEVYEIKRFLARNKIDYDEIFYRNERQVRDFYTSLSISIINDINTENLNVTVPLRTVILFCLDMSNNKNTIKVGKQTILDFLSQNAL